MRENKQMLAAKMDQQGRTHHVTLMLYPYSFFGIIKEFKVCLKTYKEYILRPFFISIIGKSRFLKRFHTTFR